MMVEEVPRPTITPGPAWLRAVREVLLNPDALPQVNEKPSVDARRTFCKNSQAGLDVIMSQVILLMASEKGPEFWETLHKKTHEGWELSRLGEILCIPAWMGLRRKPPISPAQKKALALLAQAPEESLG